MIQGLDVDDNDDARPDGLLPFSIDFRRLEIELFDPAYYIARDSPAFVDSFVRSSDARVVVTDLDGYLDWFEPLADSVRDVPLLHIFMVNRCGSTLLLNALSRVSGIVGLNELDPWSTSESTDSSLIGRTDDALGAHLRLWAGTIGRQPLVKHCGEMLGAAPRLLGGFPRSRGLFLIRHYDHVISSQLASPGTSFPGPVLGEIARTSPTLLRWAPELRAELLAAFYVDTVARYRALAESPLGSSIRCLRYETLMRDPSAAVSSVAQFFGLDVEEARNAMNLELGYDAKPRTTGQQISFVAAAPRPALRFRPAVEDALAGAWSCPLPGELA
jgi:hypothetical protein